jgi:hypothetical protein
MYGIGVVAVHRKASYCPSSMTTAVRKKKKYIRTGEVDQLFSNFR